MERGVFTLVLCSLATVTSCIDASVRIVTKSLKVGPLQYLYSLSLWVRKTLQTRRLSDSVGERTGAISKFCGPVRMGYMPGYEINSGAK